MEFSTQYTVQTSIHPDISSTTMTSPPPYPWTTHPSHSGQVTLPSGLSLFLQAQGSPRPSTPKPKFPAVIFEAGNGGLGLFFNPIIRLLTSQSTQENDKNDVMRNIRCYEYERAGIGRSPTPSDHAARTTANMASELRELLQTAGVEPPWVLVAQSLGGMIVREFLDGAREGEVVGLVLVDAASERWAPTYKFPFEAMGKVLKGVEPPDQGTVMERLTEEERRAYEKIKERTDGLGGEEVKCMLRSSEELERKKQFERKPMGDWPVVVTRGNGYWNLKATIDRADPEAGSDEDRAEIMGLLERIGEHDEEFQREQLELGTNSRFVQASQSGHNVHMSERELVAGEIRKVLREVESRL